MVVSRKKFPNATILAVNHLSAIELDDSVTSPYSYGKRIILTGLPKRGRGFSILPPIHEEYIIPETPSPKVDDSSALLSPGEQYITLDALLSKIGTHDYSALLPPKLHSPEDSSCSSCEIPDKCSDDVPTPTPLVKDSGTQTKWNLMRWKNTKSFDMVS